MRRYYTAVISDQNSLLPFSFSRSFPSELNSAWTRISPVYAYVDHDDEFIFSPEKYPYILSIISANSYKVLARISALENTSLDNRVFLTRGLNSVMIFLETKEEHLSLCEQLKDIIEGFEIWPLNSDSEILGNDVEIKHLKEVSSQYSSYKIEYEGLTHETCNTFRKIELQIQQLWPLALRYSPITVDFIDWTNRCACELAVKMKYFYGIANAEDVKSKLFEIFPNEPPESIESDIRSLKLTKQNKIQTINRVHQLKDECVQINAILGNFGRQAFFGVNPLISPNFEFGDDSLFGIGGVFAGLCTLYQNVSEVFSMAGDVTTIAKKFKQFNTPELYGPDNLIAWRKETLRESYPAISEAIDGTNVEYPWKHIVYFSNRLGFRETKYSITAAIQAIELASLPTWNMCTMFHELVHGHVRGLFSEFYPFRSSITAEDFRSVLEKYQDRKAKQNPPQNLFELLQVTIVSVISDLYDVEISDNIREYISDPVFAEMIPKWHQAMNELLVHVLDYTYFYKRDKETYVKSIWASWSTLPFISSRLEEYLLRTLCAISIEAEGTMKDIFNNAKMAIDEYLEQLENSKHLKLDVGLLQMARNILKDPDGGLYKRFTLCFPLVVVADLFLVSKQIRAEFTDVDEEELADDYGYQLNFSMGDFSNREMNGPITFLYAVLKASLSDDFVENYKSGTYEFLSLWIFSVLASSQKTPDGG